MPSDGKSVFATRMDDIQSTLDRDLKGLGFKKSGRTYNRSDDDGIVQVINLQMGKPQPEIAKLPPAIAHLRPDLYGQFTVNCGVYVREIAAISFPQKERQFVQEHGCALRARLGRLIEPGRQDVWWRLDVLPVSRVAEDVKDSLLAYGIHS
jgi:hypothetical protein